MGRVKQKIGFLKILSGMLLSIIGLALLAGGLALKSMSDITDVDRIMEANKALQHTGAKPVEPFPYFSYYIDLVQNSSSIYPLLVIIGAIVLVFSCIILVRVYRQKQKTKNS